MTQKGEHTWDLIYHYHRCPKCGFIIESREDFHYQLGGWTKDLQCDRCHENFTVTKSRKPSFGPLIGDPQPVEMEWHHE
jgi:hypothetical protein